MPTAHELTAPRRARRPALPRVATRQRVRARGARADRPQLPGAVGADVRPVGLDRLGPRDHASGPVDPGGPSWKPLPVLLTTPFSLFGPLAPDLWLFVARAGALAGVVLMFRVVRRLGGVPVGAGGGHGLRAGARGPCATPRWATPRACWWRSRSPPSTATWPAPVARPSPFAFGCALLRPEAWPLFGAYGLWLLWRDRRRAHGYVLAGGAALPAALAAARAVGLRRPPARRAPRPHPARRQRRVRRQPGDRGAPRLLRHDHARGVGRPGRCSSCCAVVRRAPDRRVVRGAVVLVIAVVWVAEVAYMTNDGFSGNARYLIMPAALACSVASASAGWSAPLPARASAAPPARPGWSSWPPWPSRPASRRLPGAGVTLPGAC